MDSFRVTRKQSASATREILRWINANTPRFTDIFDEDTFYMTAFLMVIGSILVAFILSRVVTLRPIDR